MIKELSLWCVFQLNIGDEALALLESRREGGVTGENLQANELDGRFDAKAVRKNLGPVVASGNRVLCRMRPAGLRPRLPGSGKDLRPRGPGCLPELVKLAYAKLQETDIPTYLRIGRFEVEEATVDAVRVWSYSRLDPLDLPVPVFMALSYFDGRPTTDALSMVEHDLGTHIDCQLLRTLIDFGILETGQEPG